MRSVGYGEFSHRIGQKLIGRRIPLEGTIEVTRRCPLNCRHCYNNLPMNDPGARRSELDFDGHCRILDEITEAGCLWLLYTGGEIFARRDFLDIYTYAKKKGLLITLFTNGTLLTPRVADHLAQWPPFIVEITLYGRTRETYERLTRIPGSFEKCMRAIRLLLERGLPLRIKTVAVTVNKHEIWDMKQFVEQDLGLEFKFDAQLNPRIDRGRGPLELRLTPAEIVELDLQDGRRAEAWRSFARRFIGPEHALENSGEIYDCGAGINSFFIDPQGKMSLCVLARSDSYDLCKGSFRDGWENFLSGVRHRACTRQTKCASCGIKAMCGMCPPNAELEEGDPETPVDFLCRIAHLRAHALGIPVPLSADCEYFDGGAGCHDLRGSLEHLQGPDSPLHLPR